MHSGHVASTEPAMQPATDTRFAWRFANNLPRSKTHDSDGRLTRLYSAAAHHLSFAWNNTDTVAALTDNQYTTQSASFGYDAVDRLSSVTKSGDNQGFTLDRMGNPARRPHTGGHLASGRPTQVPAGPRSGGPGEYAQRSSAGHPDRREGPACRTPAPAWARPCLHARGGD